MLTIQPGFLESILLEFGTLLGFAAFVSMLINVGKMIHWKDKSGNVIYLIPDGTADKWIAGINLAGVIALYILRLVVPDFDIIQVDTLLGEIALAGAYILGFVGMLVGAKITYFGTRGLPVIGTSNSTSSSVIVAVSSPGTSSVIEAKGTEVDTSYSRKAE